MFVRSLQAHFKDNEFQMMDKDNVFSKSIVLLNNW